MAFLGDLVLRLKAETADFQQDLGRAAHLAERASRDMARSFASVQTALAGVAAAVSVGALAAMAKSSIDTADQMYKMSQKTGLSVEMLSGLSYVAKLSDLDINALQMSVKKLTTAMFDSASGSKEQVAFFKGIGIAALDSAGNLRRTDEVLLDVADKFAGMKDGAEKTAIAVKLFGRTGMDLIPFLNQGAEGIKSVLAEAKKLGVVLSTETAKAAEDFNDNMTRMKAQNDGLIIQFVGSLLPLFIDLQQEMIKSATASDSLKSQIGGLVSQRMVVESWVEKFTMGLAEVVDWGKKTAAVVVALAEAIGTLPAALHGAQIGMMKMVAGGSLIGALLGASSSAGADDIKTAVGAQIATVRNLLATLNDPQTGAQQAVSGYWSKRNVANAEHEWGLGPKPPPDLRKMNGNVDFAAVGKGADAAVRAAAAEQKKYEGALQALEKQLFSLNHEGQVQATLYETTKGSLKDLIEGHKKELLAKAAEVEAAKRDIETRKMMVVGIEAESKARDASAAAVQAQVQANRQQLDDMEFQRSLVGKTVRQQEALNAARAIDLKLRQDVASLPMDDEGNMLAGSAEALERMRANAEEQKAIVLGGIAARQAAERDWVTGAEAAFQEYAESAMNAAQNAHTFFTSAFSKMEDALVEFAQTGKLNFKDLANSIIADLIRMEIRASVTGPLAAAMKGSGGSIFGGIGDFISGMFRAEGGPVSANQPYIVGERGPELFVPTGSGSITPNGGFGGGGMVVNIDARGADASRIAQLEAVVRSLNGTFNERAISAVFNAQQRGARV